MYAHIHTALLAGGHYGFEEIFHISPQFCLADALVEVEKFAEFLNGSLVVFGEVAANKALSLDNDSIHEFVVFFGSHSLGKFVTFCQHIATLAKACRKLEFSPLLACALAFEDIDVEICKLGIIEIEVGRAVGILMQEVGASPIEHRHKVVTYCVDALCRKVAERLFVNLNLMVAVGSAVFDGLHHGQTLYHAPTHTVRFDILTQVTDFFAGPYLAKWHVVKGRDDTLNADLPELGKSNFVFLAKPSPSSFHNITLLNF